VNLPSLQLLRFWPVCNHFFRVLFNKFPADLAKAEGGKAPAIGSTFTVGHSNKGTVVIKKAEVAVSIIAEETEPEPKGYYIHLHAPHILTA
jgi:hypothetical protein